VVINGAVIALMAMVLTFTWRAATDGWIEVGLTIFGTACFVFAVFLTLDLVRMWWVRR
jgi:hypothetical protein